MSGKCHSDAAYVLGALSPADRREYEDHLHSCADCRASVQQLAGMPGLLGLARPQNAEPSSSRSVPPEELSAQVPSTLLPALTARVARHRRRRVRLVTGLLAASFVVMIALVGSPLFRGPAATTTTGGPGPGSAEPAPAPVDETEEMTAVVPGPMTASLELVDKRWGTAITVICRYEDDVDSSVAYGLTVIDVDGHRGPSGTWLAVPGVTARVSAATAVPRDQIAALEVTLADGRTILRSDR